MQPVKKNLGESKPGRYLEKGHGGGMMQCSRRCLRKEGDCSKNGKEREKKKIRRYREANKEIKRVVAIGKESAYSQLYDQLKREGRTKKDLQASQWKIMLSHRNQHSTYRKTHELC